jgi:4-amino-4-deoxy-L-arabinose transferase-like glycosyltransferase
MFPFLAFFLINLLIFALRIFYIKFGPFDLSPEEAQYWDWSRHLALSYYSKPPLIAYLNWLSTHVLGNTEVAVRGWSALFGFLSALLIYKIALDTFKSRKLGFLLGLMPNLFVGFNALSFIFTTDTPLFFLWGLAFYLLLKAVETEKNIYWYLLGIAGGLGFLAKYSMVFFFPLGVVYILLTKPSLFKTKKPYIATGLGLIFTLPVIHWNYLHNWVSFKHVLGLSGLEKKSKFPYWKGFFNFLLSQIAILSFGFFFYLLWGWVKNFLPGRKLFPFTLFSFYPYAIFQLWALKKFVYGNWAGFAYFTGGILASYKFLTAPGKVLFTAFGVLTLALAVLLNAVSFYPPFIDSLGLTKLLPPKRDPTRVMVGWRKLGRLVSLRYNPQTDFIVSNLYQISAELAFYTKGNPQTYVFNYYQRMNQYDVWEIKNWRLFTEWLAGKSIPPYKVFNWQKLKGKNAIFVSYFPRPPERIAKHFKRLLWTLPYTVYWRGKPIKTFYVSYLVGFDGNYEPIIKGF